MGRRPDIWERVRMDIDAGHLALARQRLISWMHTRIEPHDEAAETVAMLSWQIGDIARAGRWWFLTPATGAEVDQAVEAYVSGSKSPQALGRMLPRPLWLGRDFATLSLPARMRFERFIGDERVWKQLDRQPREEGTLSRGVWRAGCSLVLTACVFFCLVGVVTVLKWIF